MTQVSVNLIRWGRMDWKGCRSVPMKLGRGGGGGGGEGFGQQEENAKWAEKQYSSDKFCSKSCNASPNVPAHHD
jgi:hypothetical protein